MIESIGIKNYKSIVDLQFDVGRVNVLIGENGSGKSNILEAIALAAAAEADKLDNEFLTSRGIRVTSPISMRSTFNQTPEEPIDISIKFDTKLNAYQLKNDNQPYSKWKYERELKTSEAQLESLKEAYQRGKDLQKKLDKLQDIPELSKKFTNRFINWFKKIGLLSLDQVNFSDLDELREELENGLYSMENILIEYSNLSIENIVIYSPEETALRNLYREGQIEPLGIHGEGLLKLIKVLANDESGLPMETIKESLTALGWFEDIDVSNSEMGFAEEERISIFDRFTKSWFDQRSANEGFLFVLFYTALMVSKDTPSIFAIDNVDASLNPKLCTKIITDMVKLAKQFDKQCFLTAHNPAVLDGIDLGDDEQRLFVVSRNRKGHTRVKRIGIEDKPFSATGEDLKLSEAFLRGYLGGLPKNF